MTDMKIAICFTGHLRTAVRNDTLIRHLIEPNTGPNGPPDIFIHTYRTLNAPTPNWHGDTHGKDLDAAPDLAWVLATYPNVRWVQMDQATGGHVYAPTEVYAKACPARWSASRAVSEVGHEYDAIFMARFDLWLGADLIIPSLEPRTLYGSHLKHDRADGDVFLYAQRDVIRSLSLDPFPWHLATTAARAGFEGEQITTALRKACGYEYRVHPVRHGLLRSHGVFLVVP